MVINDYNIHVTASDIKKGIILKWTVFNLNTVLISALINESNTLFQNQTKRSQQSLSTLAPVISNFKKLSGSEFF